MYLQYLCCFTASSSACPQIFFFFFFKYCCQLPSLTEDIGKLFGAPLKFVCVSLGMSSDTLYAVTADQTYSGCVKGVYVLQPRFRLLSFAVSSNNPALRDHQLLPALLMYSTLIVPSLIPASR